MAEKPAFETYKDGELSLEIRLVMEMVLAARKWRSLVDDHLRKIDQSSARMEALGAIVNSPPLSPQVEIAKRLRIEGPTITRMIDALEKDSLVERIPDPSDRRTKQLRLTDDGEECLGEISVIVEDLRSRLLHGISEEQMMQVYEFLHVLLERLDQGLPEPE